mgnify:CR=1 FL=1
MKVKKGFVLREVCGEQVLVGEGVEQIDFNKLISFNPTAVFLWEEASKGDFTVDSLMKALTDNYEVAEETARRDVETLLNEWLTTGLIEA